MTQEISRGMGADVAATSVPRFADFFELAGKGNKSLLWECNGFRGIAATVRTRERLHRLIARVNTKARGVPRGDTRPFETWRT
jgi:hypothetical protein